MFDQKDVLAGAESWKELYQDARRKITWCDKIIKALEAENQKLHEALSFYADPSTYKPKPFWSLMAPIDNDQGQKAREILREAL